MEFPKVKIHIYVCCGYRGMGSGKDTELMLGLCFSPSNSGLISKQYGVSNFPIFSMYEMRIYLYYDVSETIVFESSTPSRTHHHRT